MNKKHNRNKLPLILAVLLTLSLVVYGTFAYFSDEATQQTGLNLTVGNVDVSTEAFSWKYHPKSKNVDDINGQLTIDDASLEIEGRKTSYDLSNPNNGEEIIVKNARAGDKFSRRINLRNNSSLDTVIKIKNDIPIEVKGPFEISIKNINYMDDPLFQTEDEKVVEIVKDGYIPLILEVEIVSGTNVEEVSLDEVAEDWSEKAITVEAVQKNHAEEHIFFQ